MTQRVRILFHPREKYYIKNTAPLKLGSKWRPVGIELSRTGGSFFRDPELVVVETPKSHLQRSLCGATETFLFSTSIAEADGTVGPVPIGCSEHQVFGKVRSEVDTSFLFEGTEKILYYRYGRHPVDSLVLR